MADTKISAATLTTPEPTDLFPFERPGSAVARYASGAAIVQAQAASTSEKGAVELATLAEMRTGTSTSLVATPEGVRAVTAPVFNTTSYGATGGSDSTSAIQSALDAAGAAGGGVVVIEAASSAYLLTVAGNSPNQTGHKYCLKFNYDNIALEIRAGAILKLSDSQQVDGAPVDIIVGRDRANIRIYGGGRITGNTAGQTGWSGGYTQGSGGNIIDIDASNGGGCTDIVIENLTLDDHFGDPIWIDSGQSSGQNNQRITLRDLYYDKVGEGPNVIRGDGVIVSNLFGYDSTTCAVGDGFEIAACINVLINGMYISGFAGGQIDSYGCSYVTISNCILDDSRSEGITIEPAIGITDIYSVSVGNVIINNPAGYGLLLDTNVHDISLTNVQIISAGSSGFGIPGGGTKVSGPVVMSGCLATGCANGLFMAAPVADLSVSGCQFNSNTGAGIYYIYTTGTPAAADIRNLNISNNACCTNGTYGIYIDNQGASGETPTGSIVNNLLTGNTTAGIWAAGTDSCKNLAIRGNNPNYATRIITFYPIVGLDEVFVSGTVETAVNPSLNQQVIFKATGSTAFVDKTQSGGNNFNLAGAANFSASANNWLCLQYDSASGEWWEMWRRT